MYVCVYIHVYTFVYTQAQRLEGLEDLGGRPNTYIYIYIRVCIIYIYICTYTQLIHTVISTQQMHLNNYTLLIKLKQSMTKQHAYNYTTTNNIHTITYTTQTIIT